MTTDLNWYPVQTYKGSLPDELKFALRKHHDGGSANRVFNNDSFDIAFIEGLIAGGVKGAKDLLELVREHGAIQVKEES